MQMIMMVLVSTFSGGNTARTIGISMPNVPQEVPVANARPQPIANTTQGRKPIRDFAEPSKAP